MSSALLRPAAQLSPSLALHHSQQAPRLLQRSTSSLSRVPVVSSLAKAESAEEWTMYQQLFMSCLRTRDDKSALVCLRRLTERFGPSNENIMGLQGMYDEAVAEDDKALQRVLSRYESTLAHDATKTVRARMPVLRAAARLTWCNGSRSPSDASLFCAR